MITNAPRTRTGKTHPGGKAMRKALQRLQGRRGGEQVGKGADHKMNVKDGIGVTAPGSMNPRKS